MYSLFDSFFAPTRVIVVSEERLREAEEKAKRERIESVNVRIEELTKYRDQLESELPKLAAVPEEEKAAA